MEVLVEQNFCGKAETSYVYGVDRLSADNYWGLSSYYLYDGRGSVTGITNEEGQIYQSYRYSVTGEITNPLTLNRYNYTLSNYLNYQDPSGHINEFTDYGEVSDSLRYLWNRIWKDDAVDASIAENRAYRKEEDRQEMSFSAGGIVSAIWYGMDTVALPALVLYNNYAPNPYEIGYGEYFEWRENTETYIDNQIGDFIDIDMYYTGRCSTEMVLTAAEIIAGGVALNASLNKVLNKGDDVLRVGQEVMDEVIDAIDDGGNRTLDVDDYEAFYEDIYNGSRETIPEFDDYQNLLNEHSLGLDDAADVLDDVLEGGTENASLYRVMSEAEYDSVMSNGKFVPFDRAMEEKWFATTQTDAASWGKIFYPDGNYKMLEIEIDTSSLNKMYYSEKLDNIGPAYCSSLEILENAIKSIKEVK